MSDYAQGNNETRQSFQGKHILYGLMFATCFVLFLVRAAISRSVPWRKQTFFRHSEHHKSIFSEASIAARVCMASSYMGL